MSMSKTHDLTDYAMAIEIVRDLPIIRDVLVKSIDKLTPYKKYRDAASSISVMEDAIIMIDLQLGVYQKVKETRGKIE